MWGSGVALTGIDAASTLKFGNDTKAQAVAGGVNITGALGVSGVLTYEDVTNVDSIGVITARDGINVTGIVTATAYNGDGSQLTGISVGITTESISPNGTTTHLDLSKDDHKVLATGNVTIDVTGGTEADSHQLRIENVGVATVGFSDSISYSHQVAHHRYQLASGSFSLISFTIHKVGAAGTELFAGASVNFS